jgi:uncharacterized damage-inducible protein DinB
MEISKLFERDLNRLIHELESYEREEDLWKITGDIRNTPGNLALHICGNLQHFIGAVLGGTGYVRERDKEFNDKNVPREEIWSKITATIEAVNDTLNNLTIEQLESDYPKPIFGYDMSVNYFIHHLYGHLNYHLGQINYHRRILKQV